MNREHHIAAMKKPPHKIFMQAVAVTLLLAGLAVALVAPARAQSGLEQFRACSPGGSCPYGCVESNHSATQDLIREQHSQTRDLITAEFQRHQIWVLDTFFRIRVLPAMMMMTEQLTAIGMTQVFILGTFFDAKHQLESQRLFAQKVAEAHKKYHPSLELCTVGSIGRHLAPSEHAGRFTSFVLAQRAQERMLGMYRSSAAEGSSADLQDRVRLFIEHHCDVGDNSGGLRVMCGNSAEPARRNIDINFTRLIDQARTLDIDFTTPDASPAEIDVIAMSNNLYGHEVLSRLPAATYALEDSDQLYADVRSIVAKRNVAQHSFNTLVGMKTPAASDTAAPQFRALAGQFGIETEEEVHELFGMPISAGGTPQAELSPSYYAQLEALSQRLYQNPSFFANLYDKPANVARKNVAMQAIELMLDRDMYRNELRSEALLAVWLEMEAIKYQDQIINRMGTLLQDDEPRSEVFEPLPAP